MMVMEVRCYDGDWMVGGVRWRCGAMMMKELRCYDGDRDAMMAVL